MNRAGCGEHNPNAINPHIHVPSGKKGLSVSYHQTELKPPEQEDQADDDDAPCVFILFHERFYSQAAQESYECKPRGTKKGHDGCVFYTCPPAWQLYTYNY